MALAAFVVGYFVAPRVEPLGGFSTLALALGPLACLVLFQMSGLYAPHRLSPAEELRRLLGAVSFAIMAVALLSFWTSTPISRSWLTISWIASLSFITLERRFGRYLVHRQRTKGHLAMRCAIVGSNNEAELLARAVKDPKVGLQPIGIVLSANLPTALRPLCWGCSTTLSRSWTGTR